MKDKFPLGLMIFMGILGFVSRFSSHPISEDFNGFLRNKMLVLISVFALVLGLGNLILHHVNKIKRKGLYWRQSYNILISLGVTSIIGLFGGVTGKGPLPTKIGAFAFDIQTLFFKVLIPLQSTLFALLAFYMASAAYRSFRARNLLAGLLLVSAFIVMIGQVPIGARIWSHLPDISQWVMAVPNTASKRGIELGVTLGVLGTMLKILTGIERNWMGGGK
jgi:hypothetical protein